MTPMPVPGLARNPLFEGLELQELDELVWRMRPRRFARDDVICRAGEPGSTLFLIVDGLARVVLDDGTGARVVARLRRGDVIGEMSLVTGEPRSATVVAAEPTNALELGQEDFAALIAEHPRILRNLNAILTRRLSETTALVADTRTRGEAVCLIVGELGARAVPELVAAAEAAGVRPVATLDARLSVDTAIAALDDLLAENGTVVVVADVESDSLAAVVESADRAIAVVAQQSEHDRLAETLAGTPQGGQQVEVVVLTDPGGDGAHPSIAVPALPVIRVVAGGPPLPSSEAAWLGRHLARTKLGLALGAGGAKGYAHIGALAVLEEAGFTVDYVAGSSIGAIVGAWHGLGMDVAEIDATMRYAFRPEVVADIFKLSVSGTSTGLETMTEVMRETTREKSFADLVHPLVVMTVDLNARKPRRVTEGPLWEALLAATAVAGLFPPYEQDGGRLVDGVALVPVPTDAVRDAGADIVLSVNLMSRQTLEAWPGEAPAEEEEEPRKARARMLDTILEVMDLSQLDASERHAARADVVVTPRFGPASWRDFELADLFLTAGRQAAQEQLPALQSLARPQLSRSSI